MPRRTRRAAMSTEPAVVRRRWPPEDDTERRLPLSRPCPRKRALLTDKCGVTRKRGAREMPNRVRKYLTVNVNLAVPTKRSRQAPADAVQHRRRARTRGTNEGLRVLRT